MKDFNITLCWLLLLPFGLFAQEKSPRCFRLPSQLHEVSGLYVQEADQLWWHNDSGSSPILYCTDRRGQLKDSIHLPQLRNRDWEDLTADQEGNIYVGDFGNNGNARQDLKIYILRPDRQSVDSILFSYPSQTAFPPKDKKDWQYDMEAFFWHQGQLHLFSKDHYRHGRSRCHHYILPARPGRHKMKLQSSIQLPRHKVVTAAAVSPDGQTIALLSYSFRKILGILPWSSARVFYFRNFEGNDFLKGKRYDQKVPYFLIGAQYEALDFINDQELYLATEKVSIVKQKAKRMKLRK